MHASNLMNEGSVARGRHATACTHSGSQSCRSRVSDRRRRAPRRVLVYFDPMAPTSAAALACTPGLAAFDAALAWLSSSDAAPPAGSAGGALMYSR